MPNRGIIRGTHHLTFCVGGAQEDYDFHVRLLGLKSVKKTVLFDGEIPIYHLYYGNKVGDASTLLTAFPYRQAGWMGKRGTNQLKTLMLSMHDSEQFLFEALKAGASVYVLKSGADTDIVEACRSAMRGDSFLYPSAVTTLVRDYVARGGAGEEQFDILTPRELEVLKLIAEAQTSKDIAAALFISVKTVDRPRQNILDKLGMRDRVELTRYAIRRGLIQP